MRLLHFVARRATLTLLVCGLTLLPAGTALAQEGLAITTPYPAIAAQPGGTASFELAVRADTATRVSLAVEGVPDGWGATLRGGGSEIQAVFVDPAAASAVTLDVRVPRDAQSGVTTITVVGTTSGGETASLPLDLGVAIAGGGTVELTADFPLITGHADQDFTFNLELVNDTPQQLTFSLQATGDRGWQVTATPQGQAQAASVTIDARGRQRLTVTATPPPDIQSGTYPIIVEAVSGDQMARAELAAEVTGRVAMTLTTPDQRLNATATAGSPRELQLLVLNDGTAPLAAVNLTATPPSGWEVTFDPETVEAIEPGASATVTATITPASSAIAGDYQIRMRSSTEESSAEVDIRVTVETSPIWGVVGALLIAAALGGLVYAYQRYGRR